jgi:hypothetical protein
VPLKARKFAELDPTWPAARYYRLEAEIAADMFLRRVARQRISHLRDYGGLPLYLAYLDILFRIVRDSGHQAYERWIYYMADEEMYEQFCKAPRPPRSYWHKRPEILWGEYRAWDGHLEARSVMRLVGVDLEYDYDDCLGCLLVSREDDRFRATGQEHTSGCLYRRPGPVGPDDWRLSVLLAALEHREGAE